MSLLTQKPLKFFLTPVSLNTTSLHAILYLLFFLSGCAALIYQVMWQRMLFTIFGVDLESITIIVSVFMFGLGIGGWFGGWLADRFSKQLLILYILLEFCIAIFGFLSPYWIGSLGNRLFSTNAFITTGVSFLLLSIPTILMGATFPLLVVHINTFNQHIGRSVANLYCLNTLGGATGAYLSGFILLYSLDVVACVNRAALLNLFIAFVALVFFWRHE